MLISNLRESRFSRILENYFAISPPDLDLEAFKFHFHSREFLENSREISLLDVEAFYFLFAGYPQKAPPDENNKKNPRIKITR